MFQTYGQVTRQRLRVAEIDDRNTPEWRAFESLSAFKAQHGRWPGKADVEAQEARILLNKMRRIHEHSDNAAGFSTKMLQEARRIGVFDLPQVRRAGSLVSQSGVVQRLEAGEVLTATEINKLRGDYRNGRMSEVKAQRLQQLGISLI